MKSRVLLTLGVLAIVVGTATQVFAAPVTIGANQWRELTETQGYSWSGLSTIFDASDGTHQGNVDDFVGWTWASSYDVATALSTYPGFTETGPTWSTTAHHHPAAPAPERLS